MSQSVTPATQNDMTTCLETFEKERVCGFPHRHGDATGKPATRDETRGCRKTSISCETSSNFDNFDTLSNKLECHKVPRLPRKTTWQPAWKPSKRRGFAASPIDTAKPQENQRLETFRARLPSIFSTSRKMPRLPRNLHRVATWRSPANAIYKKHATRHVESAAPATENDDGHVQSAAPATKTATHLLKTSQKYCACHAKRLSTRCRTRLNVTKCHACHAKRSNDTLETSKNDHLCRTSHRHGHTEFVRTVANGCDHKRNVERTHPQPPDPQSETGTLATHSGKSIETSFP